MQIALRFLVWYLALLALCGCTSAPQQPAQLPLLSLSPASFNGSVSLVQRLMFSRLDGQTSPDQAIEAMLEIEPGEVRLAGFALGQRVLKLSWDGQELQAERHPRLPENIYVERVLRDVQFVYWPGAAINASLPPGWLLLDDGSRRTLLHAGQAVMTASYSGEPRWTAHVVLENRVEGYRLTIDSELQASMP